MRNKARWWWRWAALVFLLPVLIMLSMSFTSKAPDNLGVSDGRLAPLPASPNCVSTQAEDLTKQVEPIPWSGSQQVAIELLQRVVNAQPRTRIVKKTNAYLHAEFRSLLFRFVDDVEFYVNDAAGQIEIRSASRTGHSDFGVNRKRVQQLREAFFGEFNRGDRAVPLP